MARETSDFNRTPSANRLHISFFGRRNAGKSSVVNAITGQELSIVSQVLGTTTDPVKKAMELLPLGPVVIIDTPGIDDSGEVGEKRVEKTLQILRQTDIAVLVIDHFIGFSSEDLNLIDQFKEKQIPFIVAMNKVDLDMESLTSDADRNTQENYTFPRVLVSALTGQGIEDLKEKLGQMAKPLKKDRQLITDRLKEGDLVILVTPIDSSAPQGRLILPQVQTIRNLLDGHCSCMVTQLPQLRSCLKALRCPPALVITDSQVFGQVKEIVPEDVPLTSFSILFARFKGILNAAVGGAKKLKELKDGDCLLISEGCTHHRQCEDIGTVKLPAWIEKYTGKKLQFRFTSGGEFPRDLSNYELIVHCGGCMLNEREMLSRMKQAETAGVAFTNYGTLIAQINGILDRSLEIFYDEKQNH